MAYILKNKNHQHEILKRKKERTLKIGQITIVFPSGGGVLVNGQQRVLGRWDAWFGSFCNSYSINAPTEPIDRY